MSETVYLVMSTWGESSLDAWAVFSTHEAALTAITQRYGTLYTVDGQRYHAHENIQAGDVAIAAILPAVLDDASSLYP